MLDEAVCKGGFEGGRYRYETLDLDEIEFALVVSRDCNSVQWQSSASTIIIISSSFVWLLF